MFFWYNNKKVIKKDYMVDSYGEIVVYEGGYVP